jgi:hypothetical protein
MGQLRFAAPHRDRLPGGAVEQAYLTGMEAVPFPSRNFWEGDQIVLARDVRESGNFHILWNVPGRGPLLLSTASLMERERPYLLPVELARGTLNRLRNQLAYWQSMGLAMPPGYQAIEQEALAQFAKAATQQANPAVAALAAEAALQHALAGIDVLSSAYVDQVLALRHEQSRSLSTILGCGLPQQPLGEPATRDYLAAFNAACPPICWKLIEPAEGEIDWSSADRQFQWLKGKGLKVCAGPLLRLDAGSLPDWLYLWEDDFEAIQGYVQQFISSAVARYRGQVQVWHCAAGLNLPGGLSLTEEQKLRLAVIAIDAVRRNDARTPVVVSFDQPWGEYLQQDEMDLPAYHFADALVRADLGLSGVGLEMNIGYSPGGTLPRDTLELSRLIDRWSTLGVPLLAMLAAPSSASIDPLAAMRPGSVIYGKISPEEIAAMLRPWLSMLVAKQAVHGIFWNQYTDSEPHRWPHCGLVDTTGAAKPLMDVLTELRRAHLG